MQGLDRYRMFHTQEVTGSSPVATTISHILTLNFRPLTCRESVRVNSFPASHLLSFSDCDSLNVRVRYTEILDQLVVKGNRFGCACYGVDNHASTFFWSEFFSWASQARHGPTHHVL